MAGELRRETISDIDVGEARIDEASLSDLNGESEYGNPATD